MPTSFHVGDAANFDTLVGAESLDCLVQDPPAGVRFMGRTWDGDHGGRDSWIKLHAELFAAGRRACKPGAWSLTWALPRTSHWTACALDDAGWEITDVITHIQGQGWPKNAKTCLKPASEHWILARNGGGGELQIDASRVVRGERPHRIAPGAGLGGSFDVGSGFADGTTTLGSWPTNLLLSHCPECVERGTRTVKGEKPRVLNISASGQGYGGSAQSFTTSTVGGSSNGLESVPAFDCLAACPCGLTALHASGGQPPRCSCGEATEWACPVAGMDGQSGHLPGRGNVGATTSSGAAALYGQNTARTRDADHWHDKGGGGAARFFPTFSYAAKCSSSERHAGAESLLWQRDDSVPFGFRRVDRATFETLPERERAEGNVHPTVKSLKLAEWLVGLVCPPGGKGGDPFCGSGSIAIAAMRRGFNWIGSDLSPEAIEIARARLTHWEAVREVEQRRAVEKASPRQGSLFPL